MIVLLLACTNSGSITLGGDSGSTGSDTGSTGDDTGAASGHDPEGTYSGTIEVEIYWADWNFGDTCSGSRIEVEVEGTEVAGSGGCVFDWGDEGSMSFDVTVSGQLDDDDAFDGMAEILLNDGVREDESSASGDFSSDDATLGGFDDMTAYDRTMDYEWTMTLERD